MSELQFPDISGLSLDDNNAADARAFISAYTELRNAYLHSLRLNHSMRGTISRLSREYSELWEKYSTICTEHDIFLDDQTNDL